jgi:hypothetical protein
MAIVRQAEDAMAAAREAAQQKQKAEDDIEEGVDASNRPKTSGS